jgi:hypothetical protein
MVPAKKILPEMKIPMDTGEKKSQIFDFFAFFAASRLIFFDYREGARSAKKTSCRLGLHLWQYSSLAFSAAGQSRTTC